MPLIHFVLLASSPSRCTSRSLNRSCSPPRLQKHLKTVLNVDRPTASQRSKTFELLEERAIPDGERHALHHRSELRTPFDRQRSISLNICLNINIAVRIDPNSAIQLNTITKHTLPIPSNSTAAVQPLERRLIRPDLLT